MIPWRKYRQWRITYNLNFGKIFQLVSTHQYKISFLGWRTSAYTAGTYNNRVLKLQKPTYSNLPLSINRWILSRMSCKSRFKRKWMKLVPFKRELYMMRDSQWKKDLMQKNSTCLSNWRTGSSQAFKKTLYLSVKKRSEQYSKSYQEGWDRNKNGLKIGWKKRQFYWV